MTSTGSAVNHFGAVDETTKRLVGRCIRVSWLKEEVDGQANGTVAKKLLGIQHSDAMTSSLSVVEVAAHTERPGVQTPSRERDGAREAVPARPGTALEEGAR